MNALNNGGTAIEVLVRGEIGY